MMLELVSLENTVSNIGHSGKNLKNLNVKFSYRSDEDIKLTEKLLQSGAILDIEVLDHIIIADDCYVSFK